MVSLSTIMLLSLRGKGVSEELLDGGFPFSSSLTMCFIPRLLLLKTASSHVSKVDRDENVWFAEAPESGGV